MGGVSDTTDVTAETNSNPAKHGDLHRALIESRQRWRQFGAIAADMSFETDQSGCFTFMAPEHVLGCLAEDLLGQPAHTLLLDAEGPNVFTFTTPQHRRHTWLRRQSQDPLCMALTIVPMTDEDGRHCGTRGVAVDVTEQEHCNRASASALRRANVLDHILDRIRQEVYAPRIMQSILESLTRAVGSQGTAIINLVAHDQADDDGLMYSTSRIPPQLLDAVRGTMAGDSHHTRDISIHNGLNALACPCSTRFGEQAVVVTWRTPGIRSWNMDDLNLIASVSGVVRIVLEHEAIQRELARQARTDPLTGLLNRRAFLEEAARRLDRLERDGLPSTLLFLDLDRLKFLNDIRGHDIGDTALKLVSVLLHRTFRPTDLIARLGGDEFAVWLDGADALTAAERAESLRLNTPLELSHLYNHGELPMSLSIGIAAREPGSAETLEQLIQRADQAMYHVKRNGRANWHVSQLSLTR
jgi:diguanylate cyclase (GGDEF)-like protein